jgi:hypothetical protein
MANNIKITGSIINTTTVSRYSVEDTNLIASRNLQEDFGGTNDYIEYYVYDIAGNLLSTNYNYLSYKLPSTSGLTPAVSDFPNTRGRIQTTDVGIESTLATPTSSLFPIIEIDPVKDLQDLGYTSGEFSVRYNFFQNKISNFINEALFVKTISQDRTEIALASTTLTNEQIQSASVDLISKINNSDYYVDYLLNFGDNTQYVAVNVALNPDPGGFEILFKLYQPLPLSVQEKQTLWIVEEQVNPYVFNINLDTLITPPPPPQLRGPNFNIQIENQGTVSTSYGSYSSLITSLKSLQSSSYNQIQNLLVSQSIDINVDYTNFDNFVFFGSAEQRVKNFYTKAKEIEDYQNFITTYTPFVATTASLQTTINQYSSSITNIIRQFDGYETYLYYESSSYAWPKVNSNKPFILLSTGSATVQTWYNALTGSAKTYDLDNYDNLEYAVPAFIKDDGNNEPFLVFLNMVGQYFDNIWIYIKSITDVNLANNNLEVGISKDLVYQQLKSLGVKLYNSQAGNSVADYLIGANTGSSIFDNNFTVTGSYLNNIPRADLVAELYKRIYHNLPLLLKTKGTVAGLDYLMTTFGIPNKTYYTIGNNTFYTPTGSAVTASILNVKEFGGDLKSNLVKGYNNEKVRLVTNIITGSVLSSELSLQTFPTASTAFRENDMHYVDISFSPETQMDTYVSGAIAATNPTWVLDNYIGDPRQQYSASYPDLDAQRTLYFETGVPGFAPFTASALDYNGFIRLIEYFDNSLFKMLEDFVPERASLSTGVTITSPVLERNKVVYPFPNVNTQNVYDADYNPVGISAQYGEFYESLQGNKMPFFTGELSGSVIDINQYFEDDFNPYDGDWAVYNAQSPPAAQINLNTFLHSDWNVLLNNVSQSVTSSLRRDIQYFYGTTGSILTPAELQDSYLSLTSYVDSRYNGSKVTSYTYNTYTTSSSIWPGDDSYGKTAAIDLNTFKVAWVKNIPSQSLNFYDKTSISLKYLVDASNNLTELSRGNLNLPEVQRTFQSGDPVILSISDVKVPSNQTSLDGTKNIWKGGYSYDPILFRENNETLYFQFDSPLSSSIGYLGVKAYSVGSFSYQASSQYAINLASPDRVANGNNTSGIPNPGYVFKIDGNADAGFGKRMSYQKYDVNNYPYAINNDNKINRKIPAPPQLTWYVYYQAMVTNPGGVSVSYYNVPFALSAYAFNILNFSNTRGNGYNTEPNSNTYTQLGDGNFYYKVPRGGNNYTIKAQIPFSFKGKLNGSFPISGNTNSPYYGYAGAVAFKFIGVVEKCLAINASNYQDNSVWSIVPGGYTSINTSTSTFPNGTIYQLYPNYNFIWFKGNMPDFARIYCDLNITGVTLANGDLLRVRFYIIDANNALGGGFPLGPTETNGLLSNFTYFFGNATEFTNATNLDSYFEIFDNNTPITNYFYTSSYSQIPPLFVTSSTNTLVFNSSSLYFFTTSSTFIPTTNTQTYYTPVVDQFGIQKYDLIRIGNFDSPSATYYEVINVSSSATNIYVTLNQNVVTSSYNDAQSFAILRPKQDETSVIIDYKKQPGEVSQTILIPFDASNTIKDAVGNIFKTLNPDLQ